MLLPFSKDRFVYSVLASLPRELWKPRFENFHPDSDIKPKIHTIRTDKYNKWKKGMTIHFWRGNPRNVRQKPFPFAESECTGVEQIQIARTGEKGVDVIVEGKHLSDAEIEELAANDGLTIDEFRMWFVPPKFPVFIGKIVHWTNKRYGYKIED